MTSETLAGRYRLEAEIGSGGMAVVWRAHDSVLGRTVAAKMLHSPLAADPRAAERFKREAMLAAKISHPNMANVYDYVEEGGRPGIVMELVEGETLATRLARENALPAAEATRIALAVLDALGYAHRAGIVHRDIKPANILLTSSGGVKVADFGIARAAGDAALTQTGTVMGTAHYASPEQVRGEPATERSDLYALGAVMYEMLTGRRPFEGDSQVVVATARLTEDPVAPAAVEASVPTALDAVVMRALAREPSDRFGSAAEMREALGGAPAERMEATEAMPAVGPEAYTTALPRAHPAGAPPPPAQDPTLRPVRPRRRRFSVLALLAVAAGFTALLVATRSPATVTIPDLTGMTVQDAEREAAIRGLSVSTREVDSGKPKGTVISQDIASGTVVASGTTIPLRVSDGSPRCCEVPDLRGKTPDAAKEALEAAGLKRGKQVRRITTEGTDGRVIDQNPRAGLMVQPDSEIDLVIAERPEPEDDRPGKRGKGNDD